MSIEEKTEEGLNSVELRDLLTEKITYDGKDELFKEAGELIINAQQGSASLLQRKLKLGYNRAASIIDQMETAGVVAPFDDSKAREVLITDLDSFQKILIDNSSEKEQTEFREKIDELHKQLVLDRLSGLKNIFDKDDNGVIDIVENDNIFQLFFKKNQNIITEKDTSYIQKFVKVSNYLKTKSQNIQHQYNTIIELDIQSHAKNEEEDFTPIEVTTFGKEVNPSWCSETYPIDEMIGLLKNQKNTYDSLLYHSLSLISSLTNNDMITFYEIYEVFDKLNIFNSNFENELSQKLSNVEEGLKEIGEGLRSIGQELRGVMYSIDKMENSITNQLNGLSYTMENSIGDLNNSINNELKDLNSSVQVNNLLTGIQTYQTYKLNKNLKS